MSTHLFYTIAIIVVLTSGSTNLSVYNNNIRMNKDWKMEARESGFFCISSGRFADSSLALTLYKPGLQF